GSNNTRWLVTPLPGLPHPDDTLTWTCYVRLEFAPSSANFARIWLLADDADLALAQNGWYVQVGGISGSGDALTLVRVQEGQATSVLGGTSGAVGADPAVARLRVRRLPQGIWTLEADYEGGTAFAFEGQATDAFLPQGWYFGLWCRYTATRAQAFFFDDIDCGPFRADDQPPRLLGVEVLGHDHLVLTCSEPVDAASAANADAFAFAPDDVLVAESWRDAEAPTRVHLLLAPPLQSGQTYLLAAPGLTDLAGNAATDTLEVLWYATGTPALHDVLITEIMADPTPAHGLPEAEYVELFNRSAQVFDLAGWTFASNASEATLPHHYLLPGAYVLLTDASRAADFAPFGKTLGVPGFPALANGGSTLTLRDAQGAVVHQLTWSPDWHSDGKDEGGWSLELRNPDALCAGAANWGSTLAFIGGTPGHPNSLPAALPDTLPPRLRWLELDAQQPEVVWLVFDEAVSASTASDTAFFHLRLSANDTSWPVMHGSVEPDRPEVVRLTLGAPLPAHEAALLTVEAGFADCMGNALTAPLAA
ncbi:MAG: lamin tail domain-containing protein, partial [Caldilineae bacterium]